jgi:hypothetical protein
MRLRRELKDSLKGIPIPPQVCLGCTQSLFFLLLLLSLMLHVSSNMCVLTWIHFPMLLLYPLQDDKAQVAVKTSAKRDVNEGYPSNPERDGTKSPESSEAKKPENSSSDLYTRTLH